MEPEEVQLDKVRSMMECAIDAICAGEIDLDSWVRDDDYGREFRLRRGLELGAQHFHDEFLGPRREYLLEVYKTLGVTPPSSWAKSEICSDLLTHLTQRASGGR